MHLHPPAACPFGAKQTEKFSPLFIPKRKFFRLFAVPDERGGGSDDSDDGGGLMFPAAAAFGTKYSPRLRRGFADVFLAAAGGGNKWRRAAAEKRSFEIKK